MMNTMFAADLWFENLMLAVRTPSVLRVAEAVTFFGEATTVLALAALGGLFLLSSATRRAYLAGLVASLAGATASAYALKLFVARPRPTGLIPAFTETAFSFPSYHAVAAVAFYGFIAFFLCKTYPSYRMVILTAFVAIALAIGFSRLYLGVHFPSDVIGGYALGALWLYLGVRLTRKFAAD